MYTWDKQPDGTPYQIRNKTKFKMSPCVAPRLGLTENRSSDILGLEDHFLCPENLNFSIQGSFSN
jgi:hypothetical protein